MEASTKWNVPNEVVLDESYRTVVGRCCENTAKGDAYVLLHSSKLPYMISREHSALKFDWEKKKWTVEDMKASRELCAISTSDLINFANKIVDIGSFRLYPQEESHE